MIPQVGKYTPEELAESKRISDLLHPVGRCTCCGEGSCKFCQLICQLCFGEGSSPEEPTCSGCKGNGWANGVYPPGADGKTG